MKRADAVELIEDIRKNPSLDLVISGSSHAYMETKNQEFINWGERRIPFRRSPGGGCD